jgi:hypothetical protein
MKTPFGSDAHKDALMARVAPISVDTWEYPPMIAAAMGKWVMDEQQRKRRGEITGNSASGSVYTNPKQTNFTVREIDNGYMVSQGDVELYAVDLADAGAKVVSLLAAKNMRGT